MANGNGAGWGGGDANSVSTVADYVLKKVKVGEKEGKKKKRRAVHFPHGRLCNS